MIGLLFKFRDKDGKNICELRIQETNNTILFCDTYMDTVFAKIIGLKENAKTWDIFIDCNMATIIVDNYTLTETFCLYAFNNVKSSISIFKAKNTKLHLVDIDIRHLETEKCQLLLANSKVDELYCDIGIFMNIEGEDSVLDDYFSKFDLRSCFIKKALFHENINFLSINESSIKDISFYFRGKKVINIKGFYIHNSAFEVLNCNFHADKLSIIDSQINKLNFSSTAIIKSIEIIKSDIDNVFGCDETVITEKNLESWYLIKKANYKVNTNLYCLSGYQICKLENQAKIDMESNRFKRLGLKCSDIFLRWSIGYAYKPANAFLFTFLSILIFAVIYSCIDFLFYIINGNLVFDIKYLPDNFNAFLQNFYWSGITFTTIGYGEIGVQHWLSRFLAIIEGCLGIATMSLFVIALAKKYLD